MIAEPHATARILALVGGLLAASVITSRAARRLTVPVALLYLFVGMVADEAGDFRFEDYSLAFRLGTLSLVLILFDGGLNTRTAAARQVAAPAAVLATLGVAITGALVGLAARAFGMGWRAALLLGAVVSSTDAAATFAVLRSSGVELRRRVATTLELESGLNDPLAMLLTIALTMAGTPHWWELPSQLAIGFAIGWLAGECGRRLLPWLGASAQGLLPVFTVALALLAFGVATLGHGSGFLATYVAAVRIGNGRLPYRVGLLRVHDALAWLAQVLMFVVLGLLSFPLRLWSVAPLGLAIALVLVFVARPVAVALCLWPFRYGVRERMFVSWVGLRGAVPIVLAIFPVLSGVPEAERIFDLVFFVVVVTALVPGATVKWAARLLRVQVKSPPPPGAVVEIASAEALRGEVLTFYVEPVSVVAGVRIADLPLPEGASVTLVTRGFELVAPRGRTELRAGDHVHVFCQPEDRALVLLLFGRQEE